MAARLAGYQGDRAVLYAAVVEFIHTATLVHDDIIDDSALRRGRAAVHSRWGNDITVLLGDYLYIKSMAMALTHDTLDLVRLLCDVTLRLIHLLRQEDEVGTKIVRDIITSRAATEEQWAELLHILKERRSIDYAFRQAVDYAERAKKMLYAFPPSFERDALLALPDYV